MIKLTDIINELGINNVFNPNISGTNSNFNRIPEDVKKFNLNYYKKYKNNINNFWKYLQLFDKKLLSIYPTDQRNATFYKITPSLSVDISKNRVGFWYRNNLSDLQFIGALMEDSGYLKLELNDYDRYDAPNYIKISDFIINLCSNPIKLNNKINELGINKTSLFDRLEEDGDYLISWNSNGTVETEKIKVLQFDGDEDEKWANIQILSNLKKWNKILGFEGDLDQTPWIQLFPEDLISLKPLNDSINELGINNHIITINKVLKAWEKLLEQKLKNPSMYGNIHNILYRYYNGPNSNIRGSLNFFKRLSQSDLIKIYNDIINKRIDDSINELEIGNPRVTPKIVLNYFEKNIWGHSNKTPLFKEYKDLCKLYYEKYKIKYYYPDLEEIELLSSRDLQLMYSGMRTIVKKYVGTEINE